LSEGASDEGAMPIDDQDLLRLERALHIAHDAIGRSDPNPRVGCLVADATGNVVGEGSTQKAGQAHAEVMALQMALRAGASVAGGTVWVSLEPCSHHGRTPPCCDALISAGLRRVVVGAVDPNPLVSGHGLARMRAAGIQVDLASGEVAQRSAELNVGFFSRMLRGRPWVRLKLAASLDGSTALRSGESQWITGEAARIDGHVWRRRASAVLTGVGTVVDDNPRLDVRHVPTDVQPLRVVIDSRLRAPPESRVFEPPGSALVYCTRAPRNSIDALRARGVEVVPRPGAEGQVDLTAALTDLAARGVNELHVECGQTLAASLLRDDLLDEMLVYLAPRLLGPGRGMFDLPALTQLSAAWTLQFRSADFIGPDLRIIARRDTKERLIG
jgi:diaminohydroxyphosphoribosylaminopyrimidine deaminase/5-amino-6-(5-phosphoribosylamino)uracil reductase